MKRDYSFFKKSLVKPFGFFILLVVLFLHGLPAQAFLDRWSEEQIQFIDPSACDPTGGGATTGASAANPSGTTGKKIKTVYMRGDSITLRADRSGIAAKFGAKGITAKISSGGGTSVRRSQPGLTNGLDDIDANKNKVKDVDAVVIALGTNTPRAQTSRGGVSAKAYMQKDIGLMIDKVKSYNPNAKIFWVNVMNNQPGQAANVHGIDAAIQEGASSKGYTVIDAFSHTKDIVFEDGLHPAVGSRAAQGIDKWDKLVVDAVAASSSPGSSSSGTLQGATDAQKAFNYLRAKFGDKGAAGIVGNLMWEVGGGTEKLPTNTGNGSHNGIVQWDTGRYASLKGYASSQKPPLKATNLEAQLGFIVKEMSSGGGYASAGAKIKKASSPEDASNTIFSEYERAGDGTGPKRAKAASDIYGKYKGQGAAGPDGSSGQADGSSSTTAATCCDTGGGADVAGLAPGEGSPSGVTFPNLDPTAMAGAINKYISKTVPNSPYKNLGNTIVASAKENNINPFLIIAIAQMETGIGTAGNAPQTHSAFNRRAASGQPSAGGWYKYSTFKASVDSKAAENQGKSRGDITTYIRTSGFYDKGLKSGQLYDIISVYAPPSENDTAQYVKNLGGWMKSMAKLAGDTSAGDSTTASSTTTSGAQVCSCGDTGSANATSTGLESIISKAAKDNGANTTVSAASLDGDFKADSGGDTQKQTQSSYTVYVAYGIIRAIQEGKLSWDTQVNGSDGDQSVSGTVSSVMKKMIVNSNNAAAKALRNRAEFGGVVGLTKKLQNDVGLSGKTVIGAAADGTDSQSTTNDYIKFLTLLQQRKLPGITNKDYYNKLLSYMKSATTDGNSARDGIVAGVGGGTSIADKPGWSGGAPTATNDVGIVYLSGRPYVVAIMTDKSPASGGWTGVAKIAKSINDLMSASKETTAAGDAGGSSSSSAASSDQGCSADAASSAVAGDIVKTALAYAWPTHHNAPYLQTRKAYDEAVQKAISKGKYVGGDQKKGVDCGGFITRVMQDSGVDPNYGGGGGTTTQEAYMRSHSKLYKKVNPNSVSDLHPGDIAINGRHTFMYVGKQQGFATTVASSSVCGSRNSCRAPMAGVESPVDSSYSYFRFIGNKS